MIAGVLKKFVGEKYFQKDRLEFSDIWLKKTHHKALEGNEKYHGYYTEQGEDNIYVPRGYIAHRDPFTDRVSILRDPEEIRGQMGCFVVGTPILYISTTLKRVAETVVLFVGVLFDIFAAVYPTKGGDNLSRAVIESLEESLVKKKEQFKTLWGRVRTDFHCAVSMELAALAAILSSSTIEERIRYRFIFADKEFEWNEGRDSSKTPLSTSWRWYREYRKVHTPDIWNYMVAESQKEASDPRPEVQLLKGVIAEMGNGVEASKLKWEYLKRYIPPLEEVEGVVLYECAYPISDEKKERMITLRVADTYAALVASRRTEHKGL